jgi:hypothetical protein
MEKKYCKVEFDHALSHIIDGFVCQIIASMTGITDVRRSIGRPDELLFVGDDLQEMQVQMAVNHHMALITESFLDAVDRHIEVSNLVLKRIEEETSRIELEVDPNPVIYGQKIIPFPPLDYRRLSKGEAVDESRATGTSQ